jgi:putative peptide zinc metalloprotease protein
MAETSAPPPRLELPELRQELKIERGADGAGGAPTWLIVDPVQHRYVQIDETSHQLLSLWRRGATYGSLMQAAVRDFGSSVAEEDVAQFVRFLSDNNLTVEPAVGGWRHYSELAQRGEHSWLMWMVHNYLYIKLPLVRPQAFLLRAMPLVAPLYTKGFATAVALIGIAGLYLVSRQWDAFLATFQHFFSWRGAVTYGLALILVKSAHELGHAFTAVRFGCRVPSMGICFLVMFPVLYTDVTDAWRLRDRRQRLMIGGAGVAVELCLACLATFLWAFLPEGILKSLAFSIATIGWILSLLINLNPLMRFDGYYLFADAIGIDNLQSRAFAFGQWRMREILFGLGQPPPERLAAATVRVLTWYAWAVWLYRLVLFTGIAVLVYHMAFKLLGIALFLVEIIYFILRPIAAEFARWWKDGAAIVVTRRSRLTAGFGLLLILIACVPWSTRISIPAVLEAAELARVYPQRAGTIDEVRVNAGDTVEAGDILVVLKSAESDHSIAVVRRKIALTKMRLARRSSDAEDRAKSLVMEQELDAHQSELAGLLREKQDLTVVAPVAGVIAEWSTSIHPGRAIGRSEFLGLIRGGSTLVARGYASEQDVQRLRAFKSGTFIADTPGWPRIGVKLDDIAEAGTTSIEIPELASVYGGPIAVRPHAADAGHRRLAPVEARYLARLTANQHTEGPGYSVRGVVTLQGEGRSVAARAWRQVAAVLVRESGF